MIDRQLFAAAAFFLLAAEFSRCSLRDCAARAPDSAWH